MLIIDHTLNKYYMLFCTYLDLLLLNLAFFVLENGNFVLENSNFFILEKSWKIIFLWLWES